MGVVNLGGGSYQDYQAWTQTAAGKQSAANHQAKYGDQSQSKMPVVWQPPQNWQQQLSQERSKQPGPPVIGNAPNGRPVTGAISISQPATKGGYDIYRPMQAQPKITSQGTPYGQPAPAARGAEARPSFDWRSYVPQAPAPTAMTPQAIPFAFSFPTGPKSPADMPPDQRPQGFQQTFTDPFGNKTNSNPMGQRDALIQLLNQQSLPYYMGMGGRFTPNLQDLWGQAGNMVSNGWTNPLTGLFG